MEASCGHTVPLSLPTTAESCKDFSFTSQSSGLLSAVQRHAHRCTFAYYVSLPYYVCIKQQADSRIPVHAVDHQLEPQAVGGPAGRVCGHGHFPDIRWQCT